MNRLTRITLLCTLSLFIFWSAAAQEALFKVGFAKRDVTPTKPVPMWGYGDRHNLLSQGTRDPLYAKAAVLDVGGVKLALVGLDLGRSPTSASMKRIREAIKKTSNIDYIMISGSHTHHGPVIELLDEPAKGKGVYDDAVAYVKDLERDIIAAINDAAAHTQDARIGWGSAMVEMNRNRHTKLTPKPVDPELSVVRLDDLSGKPLALMVNFAAHPTMLPGADLRFSAEYPGEMMNTVEAALSTNCFFMQGAAGDLSCNPPAGVQGMEAFGKALGEEVIKIAQTITTAVPEKPSIKGMDEEFTFKTRLDFTNPGVLGMFKLAFFPEIVEAIMVDTQQNQIKPHLTTMLVNGKLALVGGSGEFFCNHAVRLKQRCRAEKTLFIGYCNGHHMYFPTIEGAAEGGYGASPPVAWVQLGAGEAMMDKALINIFTMLGQFPD